jgi:hypothetical protein
MDSDAAAYITAVESADGATLPTNIKNAIDAFVVGCKADGIWTPIKAACFLAGPKTLAGALTPLVGSAPTNVSNLFVAGDHNQLTGLQSNGTTKHLNSNRNNNADGQDNVHQAVWVSSPHSSGSVGAYIGAGGAATLGATHLLADRTANNYTVFRNRADTNASTNFVTMPPGSSVGLIAHSRSLAASFTARTNGLSTSFSLASNTPVNANVFVFGRNSGGLNLPANARLAFYSIGEAIDLALLDARLTTYMAAIASGGGIIPILRQHYAAQGAR